jgi:hypothetical protein
MWGKSAPDGLEADGSVARRVASNGNPSSSRIVSAVHTDAKSTGLPELAASPGRPWGSIDSATGDVQSLSITAARAWFRRVSLESSAEDDLETDTHPALGAS